MKNIRDILDLMNKKSFRLGLLLLSTLVIISASALVYSRLTYEKALNVGTTSSGSTGSAGVNFTPATLMILEVSVLVMGLSMFWFLREASRRISNAAGAGGSSPTGPVSESSREEEWEESPRKEESEE